MPSVMSFVLMALLFVPVPAFSDSGVVASSVWGASSSGGLDYQTASVFGSDLSVFAYDETVNQGITPSSTLTPGTYNIGGTVHVGSGFPCPSFGFCNGVFASATYQGIEYGYGSVDLSLNTMVVDITVSGTITLPSDAANQFLTLTGPGLMTGHIALLQYSSPTQLLSRQDIFFGGPGFFSVNVYRDALPPPYIVYSVGGLDALSFTLVPEPSTLSLVALGLSLIIIISYAGIPRGIEQPSRYS